MAVPKKKRSKQICKYRRSFFINQKLWNYFYNFPLYLHLDLNKKKWISRKTLNLYRSSWAFEHWYVRNLIRAKRRIKNFYLKKK